ncbi:MAG: ORF6N domain-containing protein [Bacteroidota bacterium]
MSKQIIITDEIILNKIYFIRGEKVMLDRDLALLYGIKPFRLREQVKRNIEKFPSHFMFQLTKKEVEILVSQNAIPSIKALGGYLPYMFSEHGVLQLSNVLKSKLATQMSIRIIEVFIKMREMVSTHKDILLKLEQLERKVNKNDDDIQLIFSALKQLLNPKSPPRKRIGYKIKGIK